MPMHVHSERRLGNLDVPVPQCFSWFSLSHRRNLEMGGGPRDRLSHRGAAQDLEELVAREELTNVMVNAGVVARPQLLWLFRPYGFQRGMRQPRFAFFIRIRELPSTDGFGPDL